MNTDVPGKGKRQYCKKDDKEVPEDGIPVPAKDITPSQRIKNDIA